MNKIAIVLWFLGLLFMILFFKFVDMSFVQKLVMALVYTLYTPFVLARENSE